MSKKTTKARPVSGKVADKYVAPLATARDVGFNAASSFRSAVKLCSVVKASKLALAIFGAEYVIGYVANSLSVEGDNCSQEQRYADAETVLAAKPAKTEKRPDGSLIFLPDAKQPDGYRTERQQRAVRAAQTSLSKVRDAAGVAKARKGGRAPRTASNEPDNTPLANTNDAPKLSLAAPKLSDGEAANSYFASAIAALLATVDVNADNVTKQWSDFIADTYARAVKAKLIPSAE